MGHARLDQTIPIAGFPICQRSVAGFLVITMLAGSQVKLGKALGNCEAAHQGAPEALSRQFASISRRTLTLLTISRSQLSAARFPPTRLS